MIVIIGEFHGVAPGVLRTALGMVQQWCDVTCLSYDMSMKMKDIVCRLFNNTFSVTKTISCQMKGS